MGTRNPTISRTLTTVATKIYPPPLKVTTDRSRLKIVKMEEEMAVKIQISRITPVTTIIKTETDRETEMAIEATILRTTTDQDEITTTGKGITLIKALTKLNQRLTIT